MAGFAISIITILFVIFIIIAADVLLRHRFSYIITNANEECDSIEAQLRILLKKYPISDIIVIDKTQSDESRQILKKLSQDFPQLHIEKADK